MIQKNKLLKILVVIIVEVIAIAGLSVFFIMNSENLSMTSLKINEEESFKSSLKPLSFNLNNLPEGYKVTGEDKFSYDGEEAGVEEYYYITFEYSGPEPEKYANISLILERYNTSDTASAGFDDTKEFYFYLFRNITEIPVKIGDQSFIAIINTSDVSDVWPDLLDEANLNIPVIENIAIAFRISNIDCSIEGRGDNFIFIFKLAKIVEQRINGSII
jgi:hypothetical protein